jgi:3-oxoacyl-[acyl-carrier protein] reductase
MIQTQTKYILITGSGSQIAQNIAQEISLEKNFSDCHFLLQYRKNKPNTLINFLENKNIKYTLIKADLSELNNIQILVKAYIQPLGKLDILINCIGDFVQKPLNELQSSEFRQIIDSNLNLVFDLYSSVLPFLRKNEGISNILSLGYATANQIEAKPSILPYHIAKMGLILLTKSFAKEEAEHQVLINCLSLGICENTTYLPNNKLPLGRPAQLKEIAEAAVFLLKNNYITGCNLEIDGGWRGNL